MASKCLRTQYAHCFSSQGSSSLSSTSYLITQEQSKFYSCSMPTAWKSVRVLAKVEWYKRLHFLWQPARFAPITFLGPASFSKKSKVFPLFTASKWTAFGIFLVLIVTRNKIEGVFLPKAHCLHSMSYFFQIRCNAKASLCPQGFKIFYMSAFKKRRLDEPTTENAMLKPNTEHTTHAPTL